MVFVFPCSGHAFESFHLPEPLEFFFGSLCQKAATASFTDQPVDFIH